MTAALLVVLALAHAPVLPTQAQEGAAGAARVISRSTPSTSVVEGTIAVKGTVKQLRELLHAPERWPAVFADARAAERRPSGVWSVDFAAFGHAHDFTVTRTSAGVMLALVQKDHGDGRLEYALRPLDADRAALSVRLVLPTPPGFTAEKMEALLRTKATSDLESFARAAPAAAAMHPIGTSVSR